ncbi:PepSY domain-containing protein [Flavobacterium hercynium]|uniref:FAD-binding oxidoreductase n=1 Tax=Flavobacterium hercynium TaxID=387094 RepID=A0A226H812_9FLAO|nr:PepSY domain-containing protein [Flavobacterium hercynium]OXA90393.1 FAD-binding oxidoreductase [Flavobacterium hercynium]SMP26036.1 sulfite reductase (NADPH) flavoprotein alpha-component [Flavobacterium hercynium]
MTLSVWRYAHLTLAVFSSLFLVLAAVTGIVLAADAIGEKIPPYRIQNFDELTLAQTLPVLRNNYLEVSEISVDHNQFVTLKALDEDGNDINAYIDAETGKVLGKQEKKSSFIQWITSLHRSLFLHETGRFIIGVNAFLLFLIAISGTALILQRQKGLRRFFSKIVKDYFAQYYHVVLGRIMLIPILILALSGTYLSMQRFKLFPEAKIQHQEKAASIASEQGKIADFKIFKETKLSDVQKIEFPFDTEDPEEIFILRLTDRELHVNQFNGQVISEVPYPITLVLENLSLDLHTGRTNIIWAIVLAIASLNILFFIYSGFAMTFRRRETQIKNKHKAAKSKFVLLAGSENGSTLRFANSVHAQLISNGHSSYLTTLNKYTQFDEAENIIIFTSTHGLGDAPFSGNKFLSLVEQYPQQRNVKVSVVGFGSKSYADFCGFAVKADDYLRTKSWADVHLNLHTIDDKSPVEFTNWIKEWNAVTGITLNTTPAFYAQKPTGLQKLMVLEKTAVSEKDHTFMITLRAGMRTKFTSGDLLAIYPAGDSRDRFYSISKSNGNIQLVVKLHEYGLGSRFLYQLETGAVIKARIVKNTGFHFAKKAPSIIMIANGTGIAPFLGMIEGNKKNKECHLYCGFRNETETIVKYQKFAENEIQNNHLKSFHIAFSREQNQCYVMDLIKKDAEFFAATLQKGGTIMICGSLAMQQDVEKILDVICVEKQGTGLSFYKLNKQILTDCY